MHKKLTEIIKKTKEDLLKRKTNVLMAKVNSKQGRLFAKAVKKESLAIIAEVKLASPSEKKLGDEKDLIRRVKEYEKCGADAVSVVTERNFFKGSPEFVGKIKKAVSLSVLQKDFILDSYQLYEAKNAGADAILLIARIVSKKELILLVKEAKKIGMEAVVEICSKADLAKALGTDTRIIAVNARDLDTFKVDIENACKLLAKVPNKYIKLGFSGVLGKQEAEKYKVAGADAILIGTSLMKTKDIGKFIREIRQVGVKICGIRTEEAAKIALESGADFLGFNFVPSSKRYIDPVKAKKIIRTVKGKAKVVGVFKNTKVTEVNKVAIDLGLDFVQLHGDENGKYISQLKLPAIKSVTVSSNPGKISTEYLLLDREKRGEGDLVNPKKAGQFASKYQIFLAGGLTPDNVAKTVEKVHPFAVDVASGIETNGQQDLLKIKNFIKNAKGAI